MTYPSNYFAGEKIEAMLDEAEDGAFLSRRDGCRVVLVRCAGCSKMFEEELGEAKAKIEGGEDPLCLACDDAAVVPAFKGITIQLGWFLG